MTSDFLKTLGIGDVNPGGFDGEWIGSGPELEVITPIDGTRIGVVKQITEAEYDRIVDRAHQAFLEWRKVPGPKRGEVVRQLGNKLRELKEPLGHLVTLEMGKITAEGQGEVQEMIDICDFATGLSRQLYGLTMQSERPDHRMFEQWHPLGVVARDQRVQLPGGGVELERGAGRGVRRQHAVEAGEQDPAHRRSRSPASPKRSCRENGVDPAIFSLVDRQGLHHRQPSPAGPPPPAGLRHRELRGGRAGGARSVGEALRPDASWSWAATTRSS